MGFVFGEEAGARNLVFFRVKWLQPAMKGTSCVRRLRFGSCRGQSVPVAVWIVSRSIGSSFVFCNEWLFLCASFYAFLEHVVADRIGMAAWLLSSGVAMCVDACGLATSCCQTHCNGCMNVAWALFWGGSRSTKVAAAGDERYLVCAAVAVWIVFEVNRFPPLCSATSGCSCVRSFMRLLRSIGSSSVFCNEWLFLCA